MWLRMKMFRWQSTTIIICLVVVLLHTISGQEVFIGKYIIKFLHSHSFCDKFLPFQWFYVNRNKKIWLDCSPKPSMAFRQLKISRFEQIMWLSIEMESMQASMIVRNAFEWFSKIIYNQFCSLFENFKWFFTDYRCHLRHGVAESRWYFACS